MGSSINYEELKDLERSLGASKSNFINIFIYISIFVSLYSIYMYISS